MKIEFTNYDAGVMVAAVILFLLAATNGPLSAAAIAFFIVTYPIIQIIVTSVWPEKNNNEE